jgi:hypothetical protein
MNFCSLIFLITGIKTLAHLLPLQVGFTISMGMHQSHTGQEIQCLLVSGHFTCVIEMKAKINGII